MVVISFLGSYASTFISTHFIGLLGLVPVYLGVKSLISNYYKKEKDTSINTDIINGYGSVLSIAAITFANGGDNIGIYIPLFAVLNLFERTVMISIFLIMVALWCWIGKYLSQHPIIAIAIDKTGHIVTPIVLILLGIYILFESGSLEYLFES